MPHTFATTRAEWFGMARHRQRRFINGDAFMPPKPGKQRMLHEALLAYEQSFALDPTLVMDFADMLIQINQPQNARACCNLVQAGPGQSVEVHDRQAGST